MLDHPNVWPEGGDPRLDLLSWYERETDTLIVRPARPLREETTYAVVLTERLVGEGGEPDPLPLADWVHHLRQTDALERTWRRACPALGLSMDDVAYAWTYTTGTASRSDLVDVRRGLYGEGPFASLGDAVPGRRGYEAAQMRGAARRRSTTSTSLDVRHAAGAAA